MSLTDETGLRRLRQNLPCKEQETRKKPTLTDDGTDSAVWTRGEGLREFFHDEATEREEDRDGCPTSCALSPVAF